MAATLFASAHDKILAFAANTSPRALLRAVLKPAAWENEAIYGLPLRDRPAGQDLLLGETDPEDSVAGTAYFEIVWYAAYQDQRSGEAYRVRCTDRL